MTKKFFTLQLSTMWNERFVISAEDLPKLLDILSRCSHIQGNGDSSEYTNHLNNEIKIRPISENEIQEIISRNVLHV